MSQKTLQLQATKLVSSSNKPMLKALINACRCVLQNQECIGQIQGGKKCARNLIASTV
jgi:hypothetical protein